MSHGPPPAGSDGVGVGDGGVEPDCDHCWFAPPWHAQRFTFVPLAVPAPLASRHSPDCTPVMVPLALTFHCWLAWPLQDHTITWVPLLVPAPLASRQMFPEPCSCLPAV